MAQFGSAPDWGSGGRRFKSCLSDHMELLHEAFKNARATAFSLGNVFLRIGDEENSAVNWSPAVANTLPNLYRDKALAYRVYVVFQASSRKSPRGCN